MKTVIKDKPVTPRPPRPVGTMTTSTFKKKKKNKNAQRYKKLRHWMSPKLIKEFEWVSDPDDFDIVVDALPEVDE